MIFETRSRIAYCLMIAWAWGAGEESCSEGWRKKLMEAGSSVRIWAQKGRVFVDRRRGIYVVTWSRGGEKGGGSSI
jgi:hypothetical protein